MPAVSIIIPTFNRSALLKQALESCLQQTYSDYEIIVVDDGSVDDTRETVEGLNSDKIKYHFQNNSGRSRARNLAIEMAQGKYITFLDSDDLYLPRKLETEVKALEENPSFGMVYSSAANIDIDGNLHPYVYEAGASGWIYKDIALFLPLTICLPTVMVRREVFSKVGVFDEKQDRFEDTDMWRRIAKEFQILAVKEQLCQIRYHKGNEMEHPALLFKALKYYTDKVIKEDTLKYGREVRVLAAKLWVRYGLAVKNHTNPEYNPHAYTMFRQALSLSPLWFIRSGSTEHLGDKASIPLRICNRLLKRSKGTAM